MADPEESSTDRDSQSRSWADLMKELTATGLATLFMTEDSVRSYLREKKIPKELVGLFMEMFSKKKDDLYGLLAKEFGRVVSKIDVTREVGKFLERHHVHLEAKVSFEPKEKSDASS